MTKLNLKETLDSKFEAVWVDNLRRGENGNWYVNVKWMVRDGNYKIYSGVRRLYTDRKVQDFECHIDLGGYDVHIERQYGIGTSEMSGTVVLGPEKEKKEKEKKLQALLNADKTDDGDEPAPIIEEPEKPKDEFDIDWEVADIKHEAYDKIKACMEANIPVYISGPAGSGKNYTVEQIAEEMEMSFYFANAVQQEYKLTGFIDAGGKYHETEFYKAAKEQDECVFFLDEMDASVPEVLVLLNAAIANGYFEFPNGRLDITHIHFVAAGNTLGNGADELYTGRMCLDQATLDRFAIIEFGYDKRVEMNLAKGNKDLVKFVRTLRKQADELGIRATFSYRCIISATKLLGSLDLAAIIKIAIIKGLDSDTLGTFRQHEFEGEYREAFVKAAA